MQNMFKRFSDLDLNFFFFLYLIIFYINYEIFLCLLIKINKYLFREKNLLYNFKTKFLNNNLFYIYKSSQI